MVTKLIIPMLFIRDDSEHKYRGEITLCVSIDGMGTSAGRTVECDLGDIFFDVDIQGAVMTGKTTWAVCSQVAMPYECWPRIKSARPIKEGTELEIIDSFIRL